MGEVVMAVYSQYSQRVSSNVMEVNTPKGV